jgi:hypothetical protein
MAYPPFAAPASDRRASPRRTPARRSASTGCTPATTSSSCSTTSPSRPRPTARSPCCCAAGPRGVPRRRLLPAPPPPRALREALGRARRWLDDRPPIIETKATTCRRIDQRHLITDGQIFLESDLFNRASGRPSTSASVSRVGNSPRSRRCVRCPARCGSTAPVPRLEAFSAFGPTWTRPREPVERGARLVELLKQLQYDPFSVERQVVSIWAAHRSARRRARWRTSGASSPVPDYGSRPQRFDTIVSTGALGDDVAPSWARSTPQAAVRGQ